MILLEYRGGLGNQLFGWATSLALSHNFRRPVYLIPKHRSQPPLRISELGCRFRTLPRFVTGGSLRHSRIKPPIFQQTTDANLQSLSIGEGFSVTLVTGYNQQPTFFETVKTEIRSQADPTSVLITEWHRIQQQASGAPIAIVHVRLGDYLNFPETYLIPSKSYYDRAREIVEQMVPGALTVVITNDVPRAKNLVKPADIFLGPEECDDAIAILAMFSRADALIGSNSTLAWWGAYLARDNQTVQIFPSRWFASPALSSGHLWRPAFTTIDPATGQVIQVRREE